MKNKVRRLLQAYGGSTLKKLLWNREFSTGRWDCLDTTDGDWVYPFLRKYAKGGSILDLGCGSGSTGNELAIDAYSKYTGVDISDVAVAKAEERSERNCRSKNNYVQSDILSYVPTGRYDLILFRDSIYYIPRSKMTGMLRRYSGYLESEGVFVVRMWVGNEKYKFIVDDIESNFEVLEQRAFADPNAVVVVFRPFWDAIGPIVPRA